MGTVYMRINVYTDISRTQHNNNNNNNTESREQSARQQQGTKSIKRRACVRAVVCGCNSALLHVFDTSCVSSGGDGDNGNADGG